MNHVEINGVQFYAEEGQTILEFCLKHNIEIPHLCWHPDLEPQAKCRICVVEVNGRLLTSCNTKLQDDMRIVTENEEIMKARKLNIELLISNHNPKDEDNELSRLAKELGVESSRFVSLHDKSIDENSPAIYRDNNKCILCGRCVQKCQDVQTVNAIGFAKRKGVA